MSREPFTEAELRFIDERAERGVDTPSMTTRFLIEDLRAARAELAERNRAARRFRLIRRRKRDAETARLIVERDALRVNLRNRTQERDAARVDRRRWYDRAMRVEAKQEAATGAEARLAAVMALTEGADHRDLIPAWNVRAAALGIEPDPEPS